MKLQTAMAVTQSKTFTTWRTATATAVNEAKSAGHDPASVLRCMATEIGAMQAQTTAKA